jgi:hypothetical protein
MRRPGHIELQPMAAPDRVPPKHGCVSLCDVRARIVIVG